MNQMLIQRLVKEINSKIATDTLSLLVQGAHDQL